MNWFDWTLIGFWILCILFSIMTIGQERKPLEPATAAWLVIIYGLLITGLVLTR